MGPRPPEREAADPTRRAGPGPIGKRPLRDYLARMSHTSIDNSTLILRHGHRADEITDEAVEIRAKELALIDGRRAASVTDQDRARALAELRGDHLPATAFDDGEADAGLSRDPAEPRSIAGERTPIYNEPEDQEMQERLVLEGVEEAQHDQMLAARRTRDREL